jgi:hypothetical protein
MALRLRPLTAGSPTGDAESALAVSDARGSFTFLSVAPGQYHLHALETPHTGRPQFFTPSDVSDGIGLIEFRGDPWSEESTWWAATDLAVGNADVHDVSVVLRRGSRLSGTLRFDGREASPSSQAQSGIVIQVDRADGQLRGTRMSNEVAISPNGAFRSVELPPGRYFLRVSGEPAGWAFHSAVWQGRDVSVVPVEIGTSGTNGIAVTFTDRPSSLSGTIRTSRGSPDLNASVAVFPIDVEAWVDYGESPRNIVTLRSDADGSYRIPNLPPGEYFAVAVADEVLAGWHDADLFARLARMAERVRVVEGEARRRDLTTVVP